MCSYYMIANICSIASDPKAIRRAVLLGTRLALGGSGTEHLFACCGELG